MFSTIFEESRILNPGNFARYRYLQIIDKYIIYMYFTLYYTVYNMQSKIVYGLSRECMYHAIFINYINIYNMYTTIVLAWSIHFSYITSVVVIARSSTRINNLT